jgi:hypothetical protein
MCPEEHTRVAKATNTTRGRGDAPDAAKWEVACKDKMRAFEHMGTYEMVSEAL